MPPARRDSETKLVAINRNDKELGMSSGPVDMGGAAGLQAMPSGDWQGGMIADGMSQGLRMPTGSMSSATEGMPGVSVPMSDVPEQSIRRLAVGVSNIPEQLGSNQLPDPNYWQRLQLGDKDAQSALGAGLMGAGILASRNKGASGQGGPGPQPPRATPAPYLPGGQFSAVSPYAQGARLPAGVSVLDVLQRSNRLKLGM